MNKTFSWTQNVDLNDDEIVSDSDIDRIPFRDEFPLEGHSGDLCYSLNPEEHLSMFESVPAIDIEGLLNQI